MKAAIAAPTTRRLFGRMIVAATGALLGQKHVRAASVPAAPPPARTIDGMVTATDYYVGQWNKPGYQVWPTYEVWPQPPIGGAYGRSDDLSVYREVDARMNRANEELSRLLTKDMEQYFSSGPTIERMTGAVSARLYRPSDDSKSAPANE